MEPNNQQYRKLPPAAVVVVLPSTASRSTYAIPLCATHAARACDREPVCLVEPLAEPTPCVVCGVHQGFKLTHTRVPATQQSSALSRIAAALAP